jgi:hypothetical protein
MTTFKATLLIVAGLTVGSTLFARMSDTVPASWSPEQVVATVNDHAITVADIDAELARMLGFPLDAVPDDQREMMRGEMESEILDGLITRHLIQAQVAISDFDVSDDDVDEFIARVESDMPDASLSLLDELEKAGISEDAFRDSVRHDLRAQQLFESVVADVADPTNDEVELFYEENSELFLFGEADESLSFDEVRDDIAMRLGETRRWEVMQAWVNTLKAGASIEYSTVRKAS